MLIFLACDATKHNIEYGQDESLGSRSTTSRKCTDDWLGYSPYSSICIIPDHVGLGHLRSRDNFYSMSTSVVGSCTTICKSGW